MGILDGLLGNEQLQKTFKDFVNRYQQGDPSKGYSDQEALKRYGEVAHAVPPDQYAKAAQDALSKLSPEDRAEFLKTLQERAAQRGVKLPGEVASDPKDLGQVLTDLHEKPGSAPGYPRRWRRHASGASARVEPDHRHTDIPAGQGCARGHRGHGLQARHARCVPNGVKRRPRKPALLIGTGLRLLRLGPFLFALLSSNCTGITRTLTARSPAGQRNKN